MIRKMYEEGVYDRKEEEYALLGSPSKQKTKKHSKFFLYVGLFFSFSIFLMFFRSTSHQDPSPSVLTLHSQKQEGEGEKSHEYIRPKNVSGFPNNSAPNHRGPCPALNTLANHGYLPRDGKGITPQVVKEAIIQVFNIDKSFAKKLTEILPSNFTLADLSVHNLLEHDASLVHDDQAFGNDPSFVNITLANQLFGLSKDDEVITKTRLAHFRRAREKESKASNGNYTFGLKQQAISYGEAALVLIGMGDYDKTSITIENARSFLVDEKIPTNWKRSNTPITTTKTLLTAAEIKALSFW
jgi:hypothetical protein